MLTKPVSIIKGEVAELTLDLSDVLVLDQVLGDSYFIDMYNWKEVALHYATVNNEQKETVIFDLNGNGTFLASEHARGDFFIQAIVIHDFDNGRLVIPRSSLVAELLTELDINFS